MTRCRTNYDALPLHLQQSFIDDVASLVDTHVLADELVTLWAARAPSMPPTSFVAAEGSLRT
jgi:hypothetical protein